MPMQMRRDAELESLATRLTDGANSPLLRDNPKMQSDLTAAAAVVRDYAAFLRMTEQGASGRDLAQLLCPGGLVG